MLVLPKGEVLCTPCVSQSCCGAFSQHQGAAAPCSFPQTDQLRLKQEEKAADFMTLYSKPGDTYFSLRAKQDFPMPLVSPVIPNTKALKD